jgi:hypothetical protein
MRRRVDRDRSQAQTVRQLRANIKKSGADSIFLFVNSSHTDSVVKVY